MTNRVSTNNKSKIQLWLLALRPKTLPAAVAPVMVGTALAYAEKEFALLPATAALSVALLLQIGVNLANDYFDFKKGVDTDERLGPVRVTQSGLIAPERVKSAMVLIFLLTPVPGLYLIARCGWPAVIIGGASIVTALAYSGGPYPLASNALGDLFVFVFFGLVAVCGTFYVQTLKLTPMVFLMGVVEGLLITAILVINNLRDIQTDRRTGKHTLAVLIGEQATRAEYALLLGVAYTIPLLYWFCNLGRVWMLLPLASLPLALKQIRLVWQKPGGPILNRVLAATAMLALFFSLLLSIGMILSLKI